MKSNRIVKLASFFTLCLIVVSLLATPTAIYSNFKNKDRHDSTRYKYSVWLPTNLIHSVVRDGSHLNQYNHAPTISIDSEGNYLILWNGNLNSGTEGSYGQRIYEAVSKDGGITWSHAKDPFSSSDYSINPVKPGKSQWQPVLIQMKNKTWAFWTQRKLNPNGGTFLSKKGVDELWENHQLCTYQLPSDHGDDSNGIDWCDPTKDFPPNRSIFIKRDGNSWFIKPHSAISDSRGRLIVAVTAMDPQKTYNNASKRIAFLIRQESDGRWFLTDFVPQGVMGDNDPWEVGLAEVEKGFLAIIRRNAKKAPVGKRIASSFSNNALSWSPMKFYDLMLHRERPFIVKLSYNSHVLLMPDHENNRRNQSAFLRRFDGNFTPALPISIETSGYWAHYSTGTYDSKNNRLLIVYSKNLTTDKGCRDILFSRLDELPNPEQPVIIPRQFASIMREDKRQKVTYNSKTDILNFAGSASAGFEIPSKRGRLSLKFDISLLSSSGPHPLVIIGTKHKHFQVEINIDDKDTILTSFMKIGASKITLGSRHISSDSTNVTIELEVDNGKYRELGGAASIKISNYAYLGDAFADHSHLTHKDQLLLKVDRMHFFKM